MAIVVTERVSPDLSQYTETGQAGTTDVGTGVGLSAGSLGVLVCSSNANKTVASVADDGGNIWSVDATASDGTRALSSCSSQITTGISGATSLVVTWSAATSSTVLIWIFELTGMATSSAFDKTASGTGTGTSLATSATSALSQTDEAVFGIFRTTGAGLGWTKGASYTDPPHPQSSNNPGTGCEYKIVASADAVTADGTWSTSGSWAGLVATYKGAIFLPSATIPPVVLRRPRMTSW